MWKFELCINVLLYSDYVVVNAHHAVLYPEHVWPGTKLAHVALKQGLPQTHLPGRPVVYHGLQLLVVSNQHNMLGPSDGHHALRLCGHCTLVHDAVNRVHRIQYSITRCLIASTEDNVHTILENFYLRLWDFFAVDDSRINTCYHSLSMQAVEILLHIWNAWILPSHKMM